VPPFLDPSTRAWVLTDGKAGDEEPCRGVAEALGLQPELRRVSPGALFAWAMPWGPLDPAEGPGRPKSPIRPPFPDLVIASGRRSVPYVRAVSRRSGGRAFTVFLKDPRTGPGTADLIWVPEHDSLRGPNVLATLTPPHRISPERLRAAAAPDPRLAALPFPRVAVLAGGDSRHARFSDADVARFAAELRRLRDSGPSLMITPSRRTPPALRRSLADLTGPRVFLWDGTGQNPYLPMLALAEAVVATADSFNMIGEAAATGAPILVFEPSGGRPKLRRFLRALADYGAVHPFAGRLEGERYAPLDSTPIIAAAVAAAFARRRRPPGASA
jgi:mitochondrial fission protein ELM1